MKNVIQLLKVKQNIRNSSQKNGIKVLFCLQIIKTEKL